MITLVSTVAVVASFSGQSVAPVSKPLSEYKTETVGAFTVLIHPEAEKDAMRFRRVRAALLFDVDVISHIVPADALTALSRVKIVMTPTTEARGGLSGRGMCYHESAGWLTANGYDAAREGTVEILNMQDFLEWRAEQPMMLLHEMAHAYHAMVGFEQAEIVKAYEGAKAAGLYENIGYVLAGPGEKKKAYAITNTREYFAELTEAWFGRNDYFPFTREELIRHDAAGAEMVRVVWNLNAGEIEGGKR